MAYYAALVPLVQLLEDIIHRDQYKEILLNKKQIVSVHEKFSHLQASIEDYFPKDREAADFLERRIRDATYLTQDIVESHISNHIPPEDTRIPAEDEPRGVRGIFWNLISAFLKVLRQLIPQRFEGPMLDNIIEKENYQDLEKVKKEVDSIVEEMMMLKMESLTTNGDDLQGSPYSANRASTQVPSTGISSVT